jgi:phosphoadenosine phosphosulfate reductase
MHSSISSRKETIDWDALGKQFEDSSAIKILEYALNELKPKGEILFLTAFGPEGCVIMAMLHTLVKNQLVEAKSFTIANLDTGYQFQETLELKDKLEERYGFEILMHHPALSISEQDLKYGEKLYERDPDQCCFMRKLAPLQSLLENKLAWITSIRREQTEHRAKAWAFEYDKKFKLGKINPLIKWTRSDIWKYIHENSVPYNPLLDNGYESIGCKPCTSTGSDRKNSRWAGKDKIECGLHVQDHEVEQGGEFVI